MSKKKYKLTLSDFSENFLYLRGQTFSLDYYPFMRRIYNSNSDKIALKCSRQVGKSTTLANIMLSRACMTPDLSQMYISPSVRQTQEFARDKVEPPIKQSPFIKKYMVNSKMLQNVYKKEFTNRAVIDLGYALLDAERIRGFSEDINYFDETQSLKKEVIDVVEETMNNSLTSKSVYAGTPKRTKGTLATYWFSSTQYEYALKCDACNHWNILDEENIGLEGLICSKCGNPLHSGKAKGQWIATYSNMGKKPQIEGYRICRLHFAHAPWVDWGKDIIYKKENQSKALFHNETLGLEYDAGSIPITKNQLMNSCSSTFRMTGKPDKFVKDKRTIMGIDYGPVASDSSNTVITVLQEREGKLQVLYAKKFLGKEAAYSNIHREIPKLMKKWNCSHLAADYGMGEAPNSEFRSRLGADKVIAYQHLNSQKQKVRWNQKMPAYTLNRNAIMNQFFKWLKKGKIVLPHWEDIHEIAHDIRNVIVEYDEDKNKTKYVNIGPDDFVHSTIFAMVSAMMTYGMTEDY